jgi:hypothetical protein
MRGNMYRRRPCLDFMGKFKQPVRSRESPLREGWGPSYLEKGPYSQVWGSLEEHWELQNL